VPLVDPPITSRAMNKIDSISSVMLSRSDIVAEFVVLSRVSLYGDQRYYTVTSTVTVALAPSVNAKWRS